MPYVQQSIDSNRSEFLKHISIVSVAGLGFNLIRDNRPDDFGLNLPSYFWGISTTGFLLTVMGVILMFYLTSIHGEAEKYAEDETLDAPARDGYLASAERLQKTLRRLTVAIAFAFTASVISAIINVVLDLLQ